MYTVMATRGYEPESPIWDTSGKVAYGAAGKREVLIIVPTLSGQSPEVVPRRPRGELSEDERRKLEHQGVPRDCHHDDLSIIKARHSLYKDTRGTEVMTGNSLSCESVRKKVTQLMNNTETVGGKFYLVR